MGRELRKIEDVLGRKQSQWPEYGNPNWMDFERGHVATDSTLVDRNAETLRQSRRLVLLGAPDSGKTFLAWAIGHHYRKKMGQTVWYGKADEIDCEDALRFITEFRKDLFIIEDCHLNQRGIAEMLGYLLDSGCDAMLLLTARKLILPDCLPEQDTYLDLAKRISSAVSTDKKHVREIARSFVAHVRMKYGASNYTEVSEEDLDQVAATNPVNLRHLMLRLRQWDHRKESIVDAFGRNEVVFESIYRRYLSDPDRRPVALSLAAVNQFEVAVSKVFLEDRGDLSVLLDAGLVSISTYGNDQPRGEYLVLAEPKEGHDIVRAAQWKRVLPITMDDDEWTRSTIIEYARSAPPNYLELLRALGQQKGLRETVLGDTQAFESLELVSRNETILRFLFLASFVGHSAPTKAQSFSEHKFVGRERDVGRALSKLPYYIIREVLGHVSAKEVRAAIVRELDAQGMVSSITSTRLAPVIGTVLFLLKEDSQKAREFLMAAEAQPDFLTSRLNKANHVYLILFLRAVTQVPEYDAKRILWGIGPGSLVERSQKPNLSGITSLAELAQKIDPTFAAKFIRAFPLATLVAKVRNSTAYDVLDMCMIHKAAGNGLQFLDSIPRLELAAVIQRSSLSSLSRLLYWIRGLPRAQAFTADIASSDLRAKMEGSSIPAIAMLVWNVNVVNPQAATQLCGQLVDSDIGLILGGKGWSLFDLNGLIGDLVQCNRKMAGQFMRKMIQPGSDQAQLLTDVVRNSEPKRLARLIYLALLVDDDGLASGLVNMLDTEAWSGTIKSPDDVSAFWLTLNIYQADPQLAQSIVQNDEVVHRMSNCANVTAENILLWLASMGLLLECGVDAGEMSLPEMDIEEVAGGINSETHDAIAVFALKALAQKLPSSDLDALKSAIDFAHMTTLVDTSPASSRLRLRLREIITELAAVA